MGCRAAASSAQSQVVLFYASHHVAWTVQSAAAPPALRRPHSRGPGTPLVCAAAAQAEAEGTPEPLLRMMLKGSESWGSLYWPPCTAFRLALFGKLGCTVYLDAAVRPSRGADGALVLQQARVTTEGEAPRLLALLMVDAAQPGVCMPCQPKAGCQQRGGYQGHHPTPAPALAARPSAKARACTPMCTADLVPPLPTCAACLARCLAAQGWPSSSPSCSWCFSWRRGCTAHWACPCPRLCGAL